MRYRVAIFFLAGALFPSAVFAASGTVLDSHTYAWSDSVGYIDFSGVVISDSALTGFAWSENKGFITFDATEGGVSNDGTGNLSGSVWGEQLGWIDFDGVSINSSTGQFSGTATGTLVGTITFDCPDFCDVATDWQPTSVAESPAGGGRGDIRSARVPVSEDVVRSDEAMAIDIVRDGSINILDFNELIVNWGSVAVGNRADMNNDGVVDVLDFNILMVYWGTTYRLTI